MEDDLARRISTHPKYQELKAKRTSFGWWLTLAMMVVYYGFIVLVAFNKPFLSQRLGDGVMTMGIPIGFGVIVFTDRHHRLLRAAAPTASSTTWPTPSPRRC